MLPPKWVVQFNASKVMMQPEHITFNGFLRLLALKIINIFCNYCRFIFNFNMTVS